MTACVFVLAGSGECLAPLSPVGPETRIAAGSEEKERERGRGKRWKLQAGKAAPGCSAVDDQKDEEDENEGEDDDGPYLACVLGFQQLRELAHDKIHLFRGLV